MCHFTHLYIVAISLSLLPRWFGPGDTDEIDRQQVIKTFQQKYEEDLGLIISEKSTKTRLQ